ncbi:hypothetical protein B0H14DRAFT_3458688 [Mycena olivaceomarginata]|nr:hypothetical protein B0H14DRAFT_3458688 [Mycena olivaceomarginata]
MSIHSVRVLLAFYLSSSLPAYPSPAPSHAAVSLLSASPSPPDLPRPVLADADAWPMHNRPMEPVQHDPPQVLAESAQVLCVLHERYGAYNLSSSLPYRAGTATTGEIIASVRDMVVRPERCDAPYRFLGSLSSVLSNMPYARAGASAARTQQRYSSSSWTACAIISKSVVCDIQASCVHIADSPSQHGDGVDAATTCWQRVGSMSWTLKRRCRARRARACMGWHGNPEFELGEHSEDLGVSIARMSYIARMS